MPQQAAHFDTIVVGSGPGGSSVAKRLTELGQRVAIIEMGDNQPISGRFTQMLKMAAIPGRGAFVHRDLSLVMRAITSGGSSTINFATAMPPPLARFQSLGIDLTEAHRWVSSQLSLAPLPESLIGPMAQVIQQGALAMGHDWQPLQKFIDPKICRTGCHRCAYGCPYGAKWSARSWLEQAVNGGAQLFSQASVERVLITDRRVQGVTFQQQGKQQQLTAERVVLSAGGIGSPRILAASGITSASDDYFVDPVIAVIGHRKGIQGGLEVPMATGVALPEQGITLSDLTLPKPLYQMFVAQVGRGGSLFRHHNALTVMVKIADQPGGKIGPHWINKSLTQQDRQRLTDGYQMAQGILENSGATGIFKTHHFAAHPGGSAAIGKVVDNQLQTEVNGLYLCDASVLPAPWGLAPSYSLLCLGVRLAEQLAKNH